MSRVLTRRALILALTGAGILAGACATAGPPAPTFADVSGRWRGGLVAEGQGVDGFLEITQEAGALQVVFTSEELGLTSEGEGTLTPDGQLQIALRYNLQCPGVAEMNGELSPDGASMSGTLIASDCTGDITGTFEFAR